MDNDGHWGHGTYLDTIKIEDPKRYEEIIKRNSRWSSASDAKDLIDKAFKDTEEKTKQDGYYGYRGAATEDSGDN